MNHIEATAVKWLASTTGFSEPEIIFHGSSSPDFTTPDGKGYEVKHRIPKHKSITLYPRQWADLLTHPDCSILVFGEGDKPESIIPMSELPLGTRRWDNLTIYCRDLKIEEASHILNIPIVIIWKFLNSEFERRAKENEKALAPGQARA